MFQIPFHRERFIPKTIDGNEASNTPVSFELSMAAGPDHARLKSVLWGVGSLAAATWGPEIQATAIESLRSGPDVFINCVGAVRNLSAPAVLCRRVGISVPNSVSDEDAVPIVDGKHFARVVPYMPALALEVAMEISRLSTEGAIDPRFTAPPSGSPASPGSPSGPAAAAQPTNGGGGTAASGT